MELEKTVFLSLGSNLGDSKKLLQTAVAELDSLPPLRLLAVSSLYETDPVGYKNQPNFLNIVAAYKTTATPDVLLTLCHEIENRHGRLREIPMGPRTLDIDILLFDGERRISPALTLPHPRMWERAFVVVPMEEILDDRVLVKEFTCERLVKKLASCTARAGVRRLGDLFD